MSLGGYKFAGYKCTKPSGATDAQFCLLMHKTRVKAFVDSCAASGANWHFCKNSGTIDFESNAGVIYDLEAGGANEGYNFASYFQYGTDDKYFAIVSMPNQVTAFNTSAFPYGYFVSTSNRYLSPNRTMFHCASLDPFDDELFMLTGHTAPIRCLGMMPITSTQESSSLTLATISNTGTIFYNGTYKYFGYATKGANITSIYTDSDQMAGSKNYFVCVYGFNSLVLSSPSDTMNLFCMNLNATSVNENQYTSFGTTNTTINIHAQTLNSSGSRFAVRDKNSKLTILPQTFAQLAGVGSSVPYGSVIVLQGSGPSDIRTSSPSLNSDGIATKGTVNIDFIAHNLLTSYGTLSQGRSYANGNYMLACKNTSGYANYYVGWDPSNPDITSEDAWTVYDGT